MTSEAQITPAVVGCRKPIRVLFLSHSSVLLGAEMSLLLLLDNINREDFEPIVVLPGPGFLKERLGLLNIKTYELRSPWWVRDRVDLFRFSNSIRREIRTVRRLRQIVSKEKVDVVYTNTIVNFSGAFAARVTGKPHIWHIREILHGTPDLRSFIPHGLLFKLVSEMSSAIVVVSNATAEQFSSIRMNGRLRVIYNGVSADRFESCGGFPSIDGVKSADWLVAVIGILQKRKGQDDAIRAVKIARSEVPNIKLLLVGRSNEDFERHLRKLVTDLDMSNQVIFTGHRQDIPQILSGCKLLLIPSWNEPFGRISIEAMAAGVPVVACSTGGMKEVVRDGYTGYIIPHGKREIMAEKIIHLFQNPSLATEMGKNARRVVKEKFSITSYVRSVENVIREVFGNSSCVRI